MLLGPIFSVELLTGARRARYFIIRVLYAMVLLVALWVVRSSTFRFSNTNDIAAVAAFASAFFVTFAWIQLIAVVLLTPAMAAGTIAMERERRTIEYLFVSHLTNVEIVIGKLAARLVQIACLLLVGMPILSLAGLLGGIAPGALLAAFVLTLSTTLSVAVLSIAISVWTPRARDAVVRAYLVLLCMIFVPLVLKACFWRSGWWVYADVIEPINAQLLAANPFYILASENLLWLAGTANATETWATVAALVRNQLIAAAVALLAATLAVRRVHLRTRSVGTKRRFRLMQWLRPSPGNSPMLWKELFAEPAVSRLGILGRIATVLIALAVIGPSLYQFAEAIGSNYGSWRSDPEWYLGFTTFMATAVACGGLLLIAARSATTVTAEKERDSWASLISTPLAARDLVLSKVLGSICAIRGVFFLLGFLWLLALVIEPAYIVAVAFTLATFLLLAFCVSSLGVLLSLWCRNSLRSMAATLAICVFVGGGYLFCCMPVMIAASSGPGDGAQVMLAPCMPFLVCFPSMLYCDGESMMRHDAGLLVAYVVGVIGYMVVGFVLISAAIGNFDQFCDRTRVTVFHRPPPPSKPPEFVVPEVVEE